MRRERTGKKRRRRKKEEKEEEKGEEGEEAGELCDANNVDPGGSGGAAVARRCGIIGARSLAAGGGDIGESGNIGSSGVTGGCDEAGHWFMTSVELLTVSGVLNRTWSVVY